MAQVRLEEVAEECRETYKGDKAGMPIVGLEHLIPGEVTLANWDTDTENTFTKCFRKGDMLFGRRRAYLKKAALAPVDGICSGDITVIRAKAEHLLPELLPFIIQNDSLFEFAVGRSAGSLSPRVRWDNLKNYIFELPSMEEQRKLAEVLWAINDTLQAYQNLLAETDALVQAQFIEMFGNSSCPMQRLDSVAEVKSGLTKNSRRVSFSMKLPYLRVANVLFNKLDLSDIQEIGVEEREVKKTLLQKNDLLIVEGNGSSDQIGRVALWDGSISPIVHQNHIIRVRLNTHEILPDFAMYYYMTHEGRQQILWSASTTSGLYTLSLDKVSKLKVPVPPIHEQQSFVAFAQQSANSKVALQNAITSLRATKRSILENALGTGRKE